MRPTTPLATFLTSTMTIVLSSPVQVFDIERGKPDIWETGVGAEERCFFGDGLFHHGACRLRLEVYINAYQTCEFGFGECEWVNDTGWLWLETRDGKGCVTHIQRYDHTGLDAFPDSGHWLTEVPAEKMGGKPLRIIARVPAPPYNRNFADFQYGVGENATRWTSGLPETNNGMCQVERYYPINPYDQQRGKGSMECQWTC